MGVGGPVMIVEHHAVAFTTLPEVFEHGSYFVELEFVCQKPAFWWGSRLHLVRQPLILDIEFISKLVDKALADPAEWSNVV